MARARPFAQLSSIHRVVTTWWLRFRHFVDVKCFTQRNQCIFMCISTLFRNMLYNVLSVIRRRRLVLRGCYTWWECEWSSLPEEFQFERRMRIHWPACFVWNVVCRRDVLWCNWAGQSEWDTTLGFQDSQVFHLHSFTNCFTVSGLKSSLLIRNFNVLKWCSNSRNFHERYIARWTFHS